jgi:hypothetical protein
LKNLKIEKSDRKEAQMSIPSEVQTEHVKALVNRENAIAAFFKALALLIMAGTEMMKNEAARRKAN